MSNTSKSLNNIISLIAYASGIGGADVHCGEGPLLLQHSFHSSVASWEATIFPPKQTALRVDEIVSNLSERLAKKVSEIIAKKQFISVIGGDHTSAIGTCSGVYDAMHQQGEIGLIWIDAHMDSHTPEATESGRLHGMPFAVLMGYGYPSLTNILQVTPKIKPENVCLIGVRSFERSEAELLKRLNVRIYFMEEVKARGLRKIFQEAVKLVCQHTVGYGISLDLDSIDPQDAPAVDVPAPNGLHAADLLQTMVEIIDDPKLLAMEIVEFDPSHDIDNKTEILVINLLNRIIKKRTHAKT